MKSAKMCVAALRVSLATFGCDSDEEVGGVAGSYASIQFQLGDEDLLAAGGRMSLNLQEGGTVTGLLTIPESFAEGEETEYSMAGTYILSGSSLSFSQAADSFVRDATWELDGNRIRTSFREITVVLEKD